MDERRGQKARGVRQRWGEEQGRAVVREWRESGLSGEAFARRKGITGVRLSYWKKRVGAGNTLAFVAVPMPVSGGGGSVQGQIEIEHRGVMVRVRESLDVEHIARLIAAMERRGRTC